MISAQQFIDKVNELFDSGEYKLVDGYAPFCKHIFVPNFARVKLPAVEITPENEHLLRSEYRSRRPEELPVLQRFFPCEVMPEEDIPEAKMLDLILYSREQINIENKDLPSQDGGAQEGELPELQSVPWGLISIKAQNEAHETPMLPMTMMRNALGREEGGSGVPLDRDKYNESVAYWSKHAVIQ